MKQFLQEILTRVNSIARYQRERGDYWKTPLELEHSGAGDCEDFAIAYWDAIKRLKAQDSRFKEEGALPIKSCIFNLEPFMACLLLEGQRDPHMVCLYGDYVLDVLSDIPYRLDERDDLIGVAYTLGERDGVPLMWVGAQCRPLPKWTDVWLRIRGA